MIEIMFHPVQAGADALTVGFFLLKKRRGGRVDVPVRVAFSPPPDPDAPGPLIDRPALDRSPRWMVEINGVLFGDPDNPVCIAGREVTTLEGIWPEAKAHPSTEEEYRYRVARADHAELYDDRDPFGGTAAYVDPLTATLPMFQERGA
jgi:hypothetical protein